MKTLPVSGMTCQSCAEKIQSTVSRLTTAKDVKVNFALKQISFDGSSPEEVISVIKSIGYDSPQTAHTFASQNVKTFTQEELQHARNNFIGSAILGIPIFVFGMGLVPLSMPTYVMALLTCIVVFYFGRSIHVATLKQLRAGNLTMDTLVSLGSIAAVVQSLMLWNRGTHHSSFEAASTIVMFILFGRYLEVRTRKQTFSSTAILLEILEKPVIKLNQESKSESLVSAMELVPNDVILVKAGDTCPVDGVVVEGQGHINAASITGESKPLHLVPGQKILSGSILVDSPLTIRVEKSGQECFVGKILLKLEQAQQSPVRLQRLADRVSSVFVPAVIVIACIGGIAQYFISGNPDFGFNIFLSVLLTACPCALGLAIPTALVAGLGAAASRGIMFRDAQSLERCGLITDIYFDKTGTLTEGSPRIIKIDTFNNHTELESILWAASIEKLSSHPLAKAIVMKAQSSRIENLLTVTNSKIIPGQGIEGEINGQKVSVLRVPIEVNALQETETAGTCSDLFIGATKVARFYFIDAVKEDSVAVLNHLKEVGFKLHLLTGDNKAAVDSLQNIINIKETFSSVHTELLPHQKADIVRKAEEKAPGTVAFAGDGVNDLLALTRASVGFAMASGTPAAIGAGHVTLTKDISDLPLAFEMALTTSRQLKWNLAWAFAYNIIMLPWALSGGLNPMWASLAMSLSSVSVVTGSVILGWRLKKLN